MFHMLSGKIDSDHVIWGYRAPEESPIFMAGLTNFRPYIEQNVEVGFVIVTEDCEGGMVDIHDCRARCAGIGGCVALDGP